MKTLNTTERAIADLVGELIEVGDLAAELGDWRTAFDMYGWARSLDASRRIPYTHPRPGNAGERPGAR